VISSAVSSTSSTADHEVDERGENQPDAEHRPVDRERPHRAEVGLAEDRCDERVEQAVGECLDHGAERGADDDGDRQVDDVAP